jgi:hypothetical protein
MKTHPIKHEKHINIGQSTVLIKTQPNKRSQVII